ncbi:MAG: hypothetical protein M1823_002011 [Watsoniomyces obsoletus]|nr:MAG: hypothetical protein M1823_002011 [Watsoniomyces obsoletus]
MDTTSTLQIPTVTPKCSKSFASTYLLQSQHPLALYDSTNNHAPPLAHHQPDAEHKEYIQEEENGDYDSEEDELGYYPDGVKRTLTPAQVAMFRHSEIHAILRKRELLEEAENFRTANDDFVVDGDDLMKEDLNVKNGGVESGVDDDDEDEEGYLEFLRQEAEEMKRGSNNNTKKANGGETKKEKGKINRGEGDTDVSLYYGGGGGGGGGDGYVDGDGDGRVEVDLAKSEAATVKPNPQRRRDGRKRIVYDDDDEEQDKRGQETKKVFMWPSIAKPGSGP